MVSIFFDLKKANQTKAIGLFIPPSLDIMLMEPIYIPQLSIHPGRICHYATKLQTYSRKRRKKNPYAPKVDRAREIANRQRKRLTNAITILCDLSKKKRVFSRTLNKWHTFKIGFATLTIPGQQVGSDQDFHKNVFEKFLRYLRTKHTSLLYVWRAECQSNGNLHYHLLWNIYIDHKELRNTWNYYCWKGGYQTHHNPNSTDIKSVIDGTNITAYVAKYMSKSEEGRREPDIKKWDCSVVLKKYKPIIIELLESVNNNVAEIKEECRQLRARFKSVVKYKYVTIQSFSLKALNTVNILRNLYLTELKRISQLLEKVPKGPPVSGQGRYAFT